jgi:pyruvate/2-oxoacid:ferredoxin oxidoreductase alpha subunit
MHEMLHQAADARAPVVMVSVNRTLAAPWGSRADHADSLTQRDTGWLQFHCESAQEALDTVLQAYRVAESVLLPALVVIEAMDISRTLEPVDVPGSEVIARFLPPFKPELRLDPAGPQAFGRTATPAQWRANRAAMQTAMAQALDAVRDAGRAWGELTGRAYAPLETYRTEDAELALIAIGSIAGAAREAIDRLRDDRVPIGLVTLRLFRPFPADLLVEAMAGFDKVAIIDRDCSIGSGGIVAQEVRAALNAHALVGPRIFSYVAGLGGGNVSAGRLVEIALDMRGRWAPHPETIFEDAL